MAADNNVRTSWDWLPDASADDGVADCDEHQRVFEFVQSLAAELSQGRIDLPTCPNVAQGMQQALDEEDLSNTRITRVIGADPGLAASVLALANGKAQSRGMKPFTDLKLAVTRIGPDHVRGAALPYVMEKIRTARAHAHLRGDLALLWERSTQVAAIARVLAVRTGAAPADVALLAGLLHNIGSIYLLSRAEQHPSVFSDPATRDVLMHDWQAPIGKAIAQNWGPADAIADAIGARCVQCRCCSACDSIAASCARCCAKPQHRRPACARRSRSMDDPAVCPGQKSAGQRPPREPGVVCQRTAHRVKSRIPRWRGSRASVRLIRA
jgi:HD-like signal output (HDOD) protein